MTIEPALMEVQQLSLETHTTVNEVAALTVTDTDSYTAAGLHVVNLRALSKRIETWFEPHVRRAYDAWKGLTSERKGLIDPIETQVVRLGREMAQYVAEQERLARIAREEEHARAREQEQNAVLAEAVGLEGAGLADEAMAVVDGLMNVGVVAPAGQAVPKVDGVSYRDTWRQEVTDASLVPRPYLMVNDQAIAKVVAATQGAVQIPGVRVFVVKVPVVGGRR